jgi:hypothetical protein
MRARELPAYARYALGLRGFLRDRLEAAEARAFVVRGVEQRAASFLAVLERGVFRNPRSPYLPRLRRAGAELGDIAALVEEAGVEAALGRLYDEGVRVTLPEYKAGTNFANPLVGPGYPASTSGTRNPPRPLLIDFAHLTGEASYHALFLSAFGLWERPYAMWRPVPPVRSGMRNALGMAKIGKAPVRWFSQSKLEGVLAQTFTRYTLALAPAIGRPEHVRLSDPVPIARWLAETCASGTPVLLNTPSSNAVRLANAAGDLGLDIGGTVFRVGGEPLTAGKAGAITAAGATPLPYYTLGEIGRVGVPCAHPDAVDDVHLCIDKVALLQRDHVVGNGRSVGALYLTTISASCPQLFLNVETDDFAVVRERSCGCPIGEAGLTTHLHSILSYDKLTSEGMTFLGGELFSVVEEVLPARFGGRAGDYQLVEEEDAGLPKVSVVVSPAVGEVDTEALVASVLEALEQGPVHRSIMAGAWRDAGTLRVVRREPYATSASKVLPLHVIR